MPEPRFARPRHATVAAALSALDGGFLAACRCWFGGGTRIVLELGEYRESEDLDFLCSSTAGYRALRSTISERSLGRIAARPLALAREVRADRYGIRTVLDINDSKLKFEIVLEGRIQLTEGNRIGFDVRCLSHADCFAEKLLANADRWRDDAVLSRDVIDLAFMVDGWSRADALAGAALARGAYGSIVDQSLSEAAQRLLDEAAHRKRCIAALRVVNVKTLTAGLRKLARRGALAAAKRGRG
jgi:Nucleotidyl transferase AbiEii toxin, Type IV TA system